MSRFFVSIAGGILLMTAFNTSAEAGLWGTTCAGRSINEAYKDSRGIALVKAAVRGDTKEVASIGREPGLVNILEDGAVPPLLWAICADNIEGFEALLIAGANPNLAGNGEGRGDGKRQGIKENGSIIYDGWSATLMAASMARPDFLKLALRHGGDMNSPKGSHEPNRPLLMAAYHGLFENVRTLVAAGADINVHDRKNGAPNYALAITGRFDIAVWLLEQGYSRDLQRLAGSAEVRHVPLNSEQQRWKEKLIDMLRARGAVFPASPGLRRAVEIEREIPPEDIGAIVVGRKNMLDYPKKSNPVQR